MRGSAAPPLPSKRRRSPRFLGRYELIGHLARGGMGTVYLARHAGEAGFQRMFAIKVLHDHLAEDTAFIDMLRDEARIAARLHHPNVVAVVDLGTHGNQHFVVMDYVEGPSFATLWKRSADHRPLDLILCIVIDALEGLHAAHTLRDDHGEELHLVHRDVSPQNILVGVDGVGRITDFGIAKAESRISSTQPGTRKGKIQFMSPEQICDTDGVDARSDVWAMGVILWSMFTGEPLFKGDNDGATVSNILTKEIPAPSSMETGPPAFLDEVVLRALERDKSKRYASALEMADALRKCANENHLGGSRQRVAAWVEETFAEELTRRRDAIREVVRHRSEAIESMDASQLTILPSLPSTTGVSEDSASGSHEARGSGLSTSPTAATLVDTVPVPAFRRQRNKYLLGGATLAGVALLAYLMGSESHPPTKTTDSNATTSPKTTPAETQGSAGTTGAATPSEPATQPVVSPSASTANADDDEKRDKDTDDTDDAKKRRPKPRTPRAARRPPASNAPALPKAAPTTTPDAPSPGKAPPPLPTPAPRSEFETNPYLRR